MLRKLSSLFLMVLLIGIVAYAATPPNILSLGVAGVATPQPDTLTVAAPLANLTGQTVTSVKINRIQLSTAKLRTTLPISVNTIRGHATEIVQADFDSKTLVPGKQYELVMEGTYRTGRKDYGKDRDDKGPTRPFK